MAPICKKNGFFGLFSIVHLVIKVRKMKINLASRTEKACSMNIQSKNQLDSLNTFLVIVVTVSKKIVLRKTRLKLKFKA